MGWFEGWFGTSSSASDPLRDLDPKLREFLQNESPTSAASSKPDTPQNQTPDNTRPQPQARDAEGNVVPDASLYKDGRYAHLWKTYRPLTDVEKETKTDHEKLMDVLDGFKERKDMIARAALENCALQQEEWTECMKSGKWEDKLQMCRRQVQKFERCYTMQSRFLRVLGYMAEPGRSALLEEDIQMHADTLFQRMIEHEASVEQAKKEGLPVPSFEALLAKASASAPNAPQTADPVDPETEKIWQDKLSKLPEDERLAEEAALKADLYAKSATAANVRKLWEEQEKGRETRKKEGKATIGDYVWGWARFSRDDDGGEGISKK